MQWIDTTRQLILAFGVPKTQRLIRNAEDTFLNDIDEDGNVVINPTTSVSRTWQDYADEIIGVLKEEENNSGGERTE